MFLCILAPLVVCDPGASGHYGKYYGGHHGRRYHTYHQGHTKSYGKAYSYQKMSMSHPDCQTVYETITKKECSEVTKEECTQVTETKCKMVPEEQVIDSFLISCSFTL